MPSDLSSAFTYGGAAGRPDAVHRWSQAVSNVASRHDVTGNYRPTAVDPRRSPSGVGSLRVFPDDQTSLAGSFSRVAARGITSFVDDPPESEWNGPLSSISAGTAAPPYTPGPGPAPASVGIVAPPAAPPQADSPPPSYRSGTHTNAPVPVGTVLSRVSPRGDRGEVRTNAPVPTGTVLSRVRAPTSVRSARAVYRDVGGRSTVGEENDVFPGDSASQVLSVASRSSARQTASSVSLTDETVYRIADELALRLRVDNRPNRTSAAEVSPAAATTVRNPRRPSGRRLSGSGRVAAAAAILLRGATTRERRGQEIVLVRRRG